MLLGPTRATIVDAFPPHSFLEESAVFLADEPMSDVEAMVWVQVRPPPWARPMQGAALPCSTCSGPGH